MAGSKFAQLDPVKDFQMKSSEKSFPFNKGERIRAEHFFFE